FLLPSIAYFFDTTGKGSRRERLTSAIIACSTAGIALGAYRLAISPYRADSELLFRVNGLHLTLKLMPRFFVLTLRHGAYIHPLLFSLACGCLLLSAFWFRALWKTPLFGAAVLAAAGYLAFIFYHGNLQPRYYLVATPSIAIVIALTLRHALLQSKTNTVAQLTGFAMGGVLAVVVGTMALRTITYVMHPEYSFVTAMNRMASIIRNEPADPLIVSSSGDDLSLFTGIPSICDAYTVIPPSELIRLYHPGWYAAIEVPEPTRFFQEIQKHYRIEERAHYIIFDDPSRNKLVLYRLLALDNSNNVKLPTEGSSMQ
ncbi:MAG: hypothetical protein V4734_01225, partial [Terriglobus sp.]